jgi:hypothetical protein
MQLILLFSLIQAPVDSVQFASIYEKPLNDTLILSLAVAQRHENSQLHSQLRVGLIDRRRPREMRVITVVRDQGLDTYKLLRSDDSTIVVARLGFYESLATLKLFLHPQTKSVRKQIDYQPDIGFRAVDDTEVGSVLGAPPAVVQQLERKPWEPTPDSSHIPRELRQHPMPQSTYRAFARARPDMVEHGFDEQDTILEEEPGPHQVVGSWIWFGKTFYDGEGHTGVGGLGYFDTGTSRYTFVPASGIAEWSVSAILVEDDAAWVGLVGYPEGEPYGAGLLRYDFKSRATSKFKTEEVVHQVVRWNDRIYVATKNGAYLVQGNTLTKRYRVEPNIDNRFVILTEDLTPKR